MNDALERLAGAGLLALTLVGGGYWWGDGAATNRDKARALDVERTATAALAAANTRVRAAEQQSALSMATISTIYQKGQSDVIANQKSVIAGVRTGAVRLSVATRADPADAAGASAACAGRRDGEARRQLSDQAAEFLTGLASDADTVALQLSACQALLIIDRATINSDQKDAE